ncbi:hypothetical protein D9M70_532760 [compost metagenome]
MKLTVNQSTSVGREQRVKQTIENLLTACRERSIDVSADQRVSEAGAGELLGYAPGSLKNMRSLGVAPPHYKRPISGSRISYRLSDLAEWLEDGREVA